MGKARAIYILGANQNQPNVEKPKTSPHLYIGKTQLSPIQRPIKKRLQLTVVTIKEI